MEIPAVADAPAAGDTAVGGNKIADGPGRILESLLHQHQQVEAHSVVELADAVRRLHGILRAVDMSETNAHFAKIANDFAKALELVDGRPTASVRASHGRANHQQATPPPHTHLHPHLRLRPRLLLLLQRSSSLRANNHCPFQTFLTSSTKKATSRALSALRYRRSLHIQSARCTENEERRATPKNCWTRSTPSSLSWPTTTKSKSIPALVQQSSPTHARPRLARFTTLTQKVEQLFLQQTQRLTGWLSQVKALFERFVPVTDADPLGDTFFDQV
ncbi:uncharacterized protein PG986_014327 [Apiospora aurea]|uniref:Uncharacterized protein n=1 Tax=Apiospora aurea TaxID=335848 RepID=A0ABR1PSN3_9PEZI